MQLIRICLLPPTPLFVGGHLTGSVARRATFFIFRIPLMVAMVGLEPTRPQRHLILSQARLPIPSHRHMCGFWSEFRKTLIQKRISGSAAPSAASLVVLSSGINRLKYPSILVPDVGRLTLLADTCQCVFGSRITPWFLYGLSLTPTSTDKFKRNPDKRLII